MTYHCGAKRFVSPCETLFSFLLFFGVRRGWMRNGRSAAFRPLSQRARRPKRRVYRRRRLLILVAVARRQTGVSRRNGASRSRAEGAQKLRKEHLRP
jgi:hypothetical protein